MTRLESIASAVIDQLTKTKGDNSLITAPPNIPRDAVDGIASFVRNRGLLTIVGRSGDGRLSLLISLNRTAQDAWFREADEAKTFKVLDIN